ncbi:MAG: hypothetical protein DRH76_08055 [Deltaproteobacteria bacterium]|nr:MAG: hypothetical protein DRH76_08055 [Deltaproteobacteria bacterium]
MVKRSPRKVRIVIVPDSKALPRGTLHAILDQAGLDRFEFIELLKT